MSDTPPSGPFGYQRRLVLRGISPLIWRRILVRSDSTIADLHATLQLALGLSDDHLHRFVAHGREYGISYAGGLSFRNVVKGANARLWSSAGSHASASDW